MGTLKFIVDECVGSRVANWLKENGFDTISILDEMSGAKDIEILSKAFLEDRILITSDKDFGDIVFHKQAQHAGIILLRLQNGSPKNKIKVLENVLQNHRSELRNNFIVVSDSGIRVIKQIVH